MQVNKLKKYLGDVLLISVHNDGTKGVLNEGVGSTFLGFHFYYGFIIVAYFFPYAGGIWLIPGMVRR